jgi:hypothetical protein
VEIGARVARDPSGVFDFPFFYIKTYEPSDARRGYRKVSAPSMVRRRLQTVPLGNKIVISSTGCGKQNSPSSQLGHRTMSAKHPKSDCRTRQARQIPKINLEVRSNSGMKIQASWRAVPPSTRSGQGPCNFQKGRTIEARLPARARCGAILNESFADGFYFGFINALLEKSDAVSTTSNSSATATAIP